MLYSAVILGFLGSLHCVGMCGPIAFMLPLDRSNPVKKTGQIFLYHFGRLLSYSLLGLLFGFVGKVLYVSGLQQKLSIIIGVVMLGAVLISYSKFKTHKTFSPLYKTISRVKQSLGLQFKKKTNSALLTIGILNGFLPCGLVYMALFGAIAMGNPVQSSGYMLLFGLGTIPLMTGAAYIGNFLSVTVRAKIRQLVPLVITIIAMLFIVRGLGLGIPYVSPSDVNLMVKANPDCVVPGN
jgi:hypothetical protein